ncbi:MAG: hypothetical protein M5R36_14445 [Deltaproteobacteria bacterium]|nr:hypothetical protein [Deltaproteobacteria bacterium]
MGVEEVELADGIGVDAFLDFVGDVFRRARAEFEAALLAEDAFEGAAAAGDERREVPELADERVVEVVGQLVARGERRAVHVLEQRRGRRDVHVAVTVGDAVDRGEIGAVVDGREQLRHGFLAFAGDGVVDGFVHHGFFGIDAHVHAADERGDAGGGFDVVDPLEALVEKIRGDGVRDEVRVERANAFDGLVFGELEGVRVDELDFVAGVFDDAGDVGERKAGENAVVFLDDFDAGFVFDRAVGRVNESDLLDRFFMFEHQKSFRPRRR